MQLLAKKPLHLALVIAVGLIVYAITLHVLIYLGLRLNMWLKNISLFANSFSIFRGSACFGSGVLPSLQSSDAAVSTIRLP
jgi:hypothetical protein